MSRVRDLATRSGMTLIVPTSVTYSGGTAPTVSANGTVNVGAGNTSITVNGCFSSTYDNYRVIASGGTASVTNTDLVVMFPGSSSGYSYNSLYNSYGSGSPLGLSITGTTMMRYMGAMDTNGLSADLNVLSPYLSKRTQVIGSMNAPMSGGLAMMTMGYVGDNVSQTGITIAPAGGNITGGTIRIYGYNNG